MQIIKHGEYEAEFRRNDYIYKPVCPECGCKTVSRG